MNQTATAGINLSSLTRYDYVPGEAGRMIIGQDDNGSYLLRADVEALLARRAEPSVAADERELFELAAKYGRKDKFDFRIPGTSKSHKVECVVMEASDVARFAAALASPAVSQKDGAAVASLGDLLMPKAQREAILAKTAATTASASDACAAMRALCSNCGGTGSVHRADGEYMGECDCKASSWSRAPAPSRDADDLRAAAAAVVARWDSVLWRQEVGTNELINRLRAALARAQQGDADKLAEAIHAAAVKAGIIKPGTVVTGPQLLMLCDDLARAPLPDRGAIDEREGVMGLRPYEFSVCGKSLRWYLKRDVDAILSAAPAQAGDAREDSERLNYIESGHLALDPCEDQDGIRCYEVNEILGDKEDDSKRTLGFGLTPRAAIDAARTAYQDKGGAA